ncbi:MAG: hypothetical protein PUE12_18655 [Oscillospiraceae bacterium]|nr:hypothetical protein [Oscillospiraceae bacterium]
MNDGIMYNYFDYNGVRYYTGSKFKCNNFLKTDVQLFPEIEVTFIKRNKKSNTCFIHSNVAMCDFEFQLSTFINNIIDVVYSNTKEVVDIMNEKYKNDKKYYHWVEDGEDCYKAKPDELVIGWMWYVFFMAIVTIFNWNVWLWALITIIFIKWRKNKIKEG